MNNNIYFLLDPAHYKRPRKGRFREIFKNGFFCVDLWISFYCKAIEGRYFSHKIIFSSRFRCQNLKISLIEMEVDFLRSQFLLQNHGKSVSRCEKFDDDSIRYVDKQLRKAYRGINRVRRCHFLTGRTSRYVKIEQIGLRAFWGYLNILQL